MSTHLRPLTAVAGILLAMSATFAVNVPAAAECTGYEHPRPARISDFTGYAFSARVTDATRDAGPSPPGDAPFDWHVELAVDHAYAGDVPDTITSEGWSVGCASLRGDQLRTGDRVFIISSALPRGAQDRRWRGDSLVWIATVDGWRQYRRAFNVSGMYSSLPAETRGDLTTTRLVALATDLPATHETGRAGGGGRPPDLLALVAGASAGVMVFRRRLGPVHRQPR
jgi:hypothetical protein